MKKIYIVVLIIITITFNLLGDNVEYHKNYKKENKERYYKFKEKNKNFTNDEIIKRVNLDLDYNYYEKTFDALNLDTYLVLVNKYYKLKDDYVPKNLVKIDYTLTSGLDIYGEKEAVKHFKEMSMDASNIGLIIKTISVYRSYEYQKNLYNNYLKTDEVSIVDTYSARAGHSEHQTGLAFDIYNVKYPYTEFGNTEEFKWLKDNAYKYGFILRYKKEFEHITGYKEEPWHIRYVGNAAEEIYKSNITLEEYILNKKQ